ncbi:hypothetical protein [Halopelagius longus]|uniref:Uncharacterized protein n=1 Tax=Halopelagius longus TaxID=1236180 RepID=A0A1H0Y569_9EURY|nr:hypothetical protein [Halopelagius longus]RDI72283.1 hypothetical protein DWB78_11495 [Halopelagius longus]SDQ10304.1 hypothetical protein SAMN05216278_0411 [Halopelagius longus]
MNGRSLREMLDRRPDTEAGRVVRRIWLARGYEAAVRFSGPDLYVEARGRTDEGATRRIRAWVSSEGTIDRRRMRAFVNACERDDAEPHVVTLGTAQIADDAHLPGVWEFDASRLAVEVRDAGVEAAVRALEAEAESTAEEDASENWFGEPVEDDGDSEDDDETDEEELTRRDAARITGKYVVGGLVTYLFVESLSDAVRASPELRRTVREATTPLWSHVPAMPSGEGASDGGGGVGTGTGTPDYGNPTSGERVENATAIPYDELAADAAANAGRNVRYEGVVRSTVEGVTERGVRLAVTPGPNGSWSDEIACRWPSGRLYEDAVRFRLLEGERIRVWGVVRGATEATRTERSIPLVEVVGIASVES